MFLVEFFKFFKYEFQVLFILVGVWFLLVLVLSLFFLGLDDGLTSSIDVGLGVGVGLVRLRVG